MALYFSDQPFAGQMWVQGAKAPPTPSVAFSWNQAGFLFSGMAHSLVRFSAFCLSSPQWLSLTFPFKIAAHSHRDHHSLLPLPVFPHSTHQDMASGYLLALLSVT